MLQPSHCPPPPPPVLILNLTHTCRRIALILHVWSIQAEIATGRKHVFGGTPKWDPTKIKGLVGVSGVYNCADLRQHFNQRGLYYSLFDRIMSFQGKTQLKALSPTYVVHGARYAHLMPPVLLLHGTRDTCAPLHNATQFAKALLGAGIQVPHVSTFRACMLLELHCATGRLQAYKRVSIWQACWL